ncbi:TPA: hypothetical protein ACIJVJ_003110 [Raoultella planticola]|nr:hypothetical protein [Klebsiella pneumoniae]
MTQTITPVKTYETLGGATVNCAPETIEVTYTALNLFSLVNGVATVDFNLSLPGGVTAGRLQFSFDYSGSGNLMETAETELQRHLIS